LTKQIFPCPRPNHQIISNWSAKNAEYVLYSLLPLLLDAFPTTIRLFWFWLFDGDIMPFVWDNILKIFEFANGLGLPSQTSYCKVSQTETNVVNSNLLNAFSISVSWRNRVWCVEENFELLWCDVLECCLHIIRFLTRITSLSGIQWCHKWGYWN